MAAKATTAKKRTSGEDSAKPNVVPYAARTAQSWTYESIRSAVNSQLTGDFQRISALATSMLLDESYSAAVGKRINGLVRSALTFEAYDTKEPLAPQAVDLCTRHAPVVLDETEHRACMTDYHDVGVYLGRIEVRAVKGLLLPCLRHLSTHTLRFDQERRVWLYQAQDGEHVVTPGDGQWVLITAWHPGYPAGFVPQLADIWADGTLARRSWVDWCDNSGFPITKAITPADGPADQKAQFVSDIAGLKTSKVIECPQDSDGKGFDVDVMPSTAAEGYAGLKELVEHKRLMFQLAILGGNLSSEVSDVGSHAAAQTHMGVQRELIASDARLMSAGLREQLFRPAVEWNLGPTVETPIPCWDVSPPQDPKATMDAMNAFVTLLSGMNDSGWQVDNLVEIAERIGMQISRRSSETP